MKNLKSDQLEVGKRYSWDSYPYEKSGEYTGHNERGDIHFENVQYPDGWQRDQIDDTTGASFDPLTHKRFEEVI